MQPRVQTVRNIQALNAASKTSSPFKAEEEQQQENKNMKMKNEAEQEQEGGFCPLT
jgi:hypothetical protein